LSHCEFKKVKKNHQLCTDSNEKFTDKSIWIIATTDIKRI